MKFFSKTKKLKSYGSVNLHLISNGTDLTALELSDGKTDSTPFKKLFHDLDYYICLVLNLSKSSKLNNHSICWISTLN